MLPPPKGDPTDDSMLGDSSSDSNGASPKCQKWLNVDRVISAVLFIVVVASVSVLISVATKSIDMPRLLQFVLIANAFLGLIFLIIIATSGMFACSSKAAKSPSSRVEKRNVVVMSVDGR